MLIIKTNQPNSLVVTVSQNSELPNPEYLFSFTHIFSKQNVSFIPVDVSLHKSRYDEFYFVEGTGVGEIHFPYEGLYLYSISEQTMGSGNLDPALAYNVVENGEAQIIVQSAITVDSQFDTYISPNEDNSNIIFAPDEPNPTPNVSASPTPTPSVTPTFTPTASVTPTITPTPTFTPTPSPTPLPANINPATLGALWWIDFTDASTLTFDGGNISTATDKIASVVFSADPGGPVYNATGYLGVSGDVRSNVTQLKNQSGDYGNVGEYTWFGFVYDDKVSQRGGKIFVGANNPGWPGGDAFALMIDPNNLIVWRFQDRTTTGSGNIVDTDITFSAWTPVAMRSYNSGSNLTLEVWENGSIIASGTSLGSAYIATDPIFSLMFDGGIDFNTEQFFFDKKLNDSEMTQMFLYLNNKY
jgi:hypothetical protein